MVLRLVMRRCVVSMARRRMSQDGDKVGQSAVVILSLGVVAEALFGCAKVVVSSGVAHWCGEGLVLRLLGEPGVPLMSLCSFVAENTATTYVEERGPASRYPWVHVRCLRCGRLPSKGGGQRFTCRHNIPPALSRPLALVQVRSHTRASQGMLAAKKGCVPFCEWLGGHFCVMWCDILAADPSVVVQACCCEAL